MEIVNRFYFETSETICLCEITPTQDGTGYKAQCSGYSPAGERFLKNVCNFKATAATPEELYTICSEALAKQQGPIITKRHDKPFE